MDVGCRRLIRIHTLIRSIGNLGISLDARSNWATDGLLNMDHAEATDLNQQGHSHWISSLSLSAGLSRSVLPTYGPRSTVQGPRSHGRAGGWCGKIDNDGGWCLVPGSSRGFFSLYFLRLSSSSSSSLSSYGMYFQFARRHWWSSSRRRNPALASQPASQPARRGRPIRRCCSHERLVAGCSAPCF